jgi:hypothetical protein
MNYYRAFPQLFFRDHRIIGENFANHPVIKLSEFDIQSAQNRLYLPKYKWLAEKLRITVCYATPLESYTSGVEKFLMTLEKSPEFDLAKNGDSSAKARLHSQVADMSIAMKVALSNGDLFVNV